VTDLAILNPSQRAAFSRALANCNKVEPIIKYLETIAKVSPPLNDRVDELRTRCDYLKTLSETALAADATQGS
jgi:hypothetical protein